MNDTNSIRKEISILTLVSYLGHTLLMLRGFVLASVLGPATYGFWIFFKDLFDLSSSTGFGASQSMARQIPENKAQRLHTLNQALVKATLGWNLLIGLLIIGVLVLLNSLTQYIPNTTQLWLVSVLFILFIVHHFQRFRYKGEQRLLFFSRYKTVFVVTNAIFTIAFVFYFGLNGALIGLLACLAISFGYLFAANDFLVPSIPKLHTGLQQMRDGFPQFINSYVWFLCRATDRLVILTLLGSNMVGFFGLAGFLTAIISEIPLSLAHVLFPRTILTFQETQDRYAIARFFEQPLLLNAALVCVLIGFIYLNTAWLVEWVLPEYSFSIQLLKILIFGVFFSALWILTSNILLTLHKDNRQLKLSVFILLTTLAVDIAVVLWGGGIVSVAITSVSIAGMSSLFIVGYTQWLLTHSKRKTVIFVLKILLPIIYSLIVIALIDLVLPISHDINSVLASNALWFIACFPFLLKIMRAAGYIGDKKSGSLSRYS